MTPRRRKMLGALRDAAILIALLAAPTALVLWVQG